MGAQSLLIGDPIPIGPNPDDLYQRAVAGTSCRHGGSRRASASTVFRFGSALPLTDEICERDKHLNAEVQRRLAEQFINFLQHEQLIGTLLLQENHSR